MPDPNALGACLYVPATHPDLDAIAAGHKLQAVRTLVLCTEDAVAERDLPCALEKLASTLPRIARGHGQHVFVRARSPQLMGAILRMECAGKVDGFVLPKITAANVGRYLRQLPDSMSVMLTLETREVFSDHDMQALLRLLDKSRYRDRIVTLRIGGNDLLALLRIRRPRRKTIYETPIGQVIARLATTYIPYGFTLSAPVFEYLDDTETLAREIQADLDHGLVGKTAIHPSQVPLIEGFYRVSSQDVRVATAILAADAPGVFAARGAMCEPATHRPWARCVLSAAHHFGHVDALSGAN